MWEVKAKETGIAGVLGSLILESHAAPSLTPSVLADMGDHGLAGLGQSKVRGQASWDPAGQDPTPSYAIVRSRENPQWKGKACRVSRSCLNSFSCWQGANEVLTWGVVVGRGGRQRGLSGRKSRSEPASKALS